MILSLLEGPLKPYLAAIHAILWVGLFAAGAGLGWSVKSRFDASTLATLKQQWSDQKTRDAQHAMMVQTQRDQDAQQALQKALQETKDTEAAKAQLEKQYANLQATNAAVTAANRKLRDAATAYASNGRTAAPAACAGAYGRSAVLAELYNQSGAFTAECAGLLQQAIGVASQFAEDAERLAIQVRGLQAYGASVSK